LQTPGQRQVPALQEHCRPHASRQPVSGVHACPSTTGVEQSGAACCAQLHVLPAMSLSLQLHFVTGGVASVNHVQTVPACE
jgi:hypothetical protein